MSRRKQANPAKLGETDGVSVNIANDTSLGTGECSSQNNPEQDIDVKKENEEEDDQDVEEDDDEELDEDDEDDDDEDGSLLNGQGSSPLSSSDQASPASSCQSSLSDAADAEEGSTLGATPTTPYECEVCKRAFPRSSLLSKHIQTHTEQLQFSCPYCRRLFKHKRSRDRHTKLHTGDKKYKCLHCESAFARSDHLKIHMKTHDNKKPHQCDLCNRGYNTAAALASHQQHHSKQEQRRSESSNSRSSVSASSPSPGVFRCGQCPETFDRSELLQNHLLLCHKPSDSPTIPSQPSNSLELPKIACMYCSKDFLTMTHMYQHIHSEHRAIYNSISNMSSPNPTSLPALAIPSPNPVEDLSPKVRNNSPTYACDRCTMRFDSSLLLQEHVENVHWPSHPRYKYDYRDIGILEQKPTDLSRKRRHEDVHQESNASDCSKPEKRTSLEPSSKQAGASPYESNDKPCICSYCYAQMPNFKMFLLHMETHVAMNTVTMPQKILASCPLCGETAKNALDLGRHIFGHAIANVSAFCCHSCKKPFEKVEHLKKHLQEVHSQTVYKCTICSDIFDTESGLQMHFSNKHTPECKHFRCNLCSEQVFHDRLTAELHVNMKHSIQTPHGGNPQSYLRFPEMENPIQRVLIDRTELPFYQCPFCQKIFKDEYLQYVHMLKEHNQMRSSPMEKQKSMDTIKTFKCEVCNRCNITSEAELAAHKKLHHAKTKLPAVSLQCAYCNEHCKSRADLEHHMKSHQVSCGKGKHKCNICDEIFSTSTTLAEHKLSHCKIVAGNSCTQCKALLADEQSFYNHQLQHSTSSSNNTSKSMLSLPANCIVCCQTLQTDVEIKLHAKFHLRHLMQLQKEFLCAVCNKLCDSSSVSHSLQMAIYVCKECAGATNGTHGHTQSPSSKSESPIRDCKEKHLFACLKCPRTFTTEEETQTHAAGHMMNEEPSLECHLCRNVLPSPTKLQVHLIEHNFMGIGQYRCYVCSSVFTTAAGLRNHIVGHGLDHRPYECTECKMKFYFETELENHKFAHLQQIKTYDKYIECKKCAQSIPEAAYYSDHVHTCNGHQQEGERTGSDVNNSSERLPAAETTDASNPDVQLGSNSHIVNIKVESERSDFEYHDHKIKTESSD